MRRRCIGKAIMTLSTDKAGRRVIGTTGKLTSPGVTATQLRRRSFIPKASIRFALQSKVTTLPLMTVK